MAGELSTILKERFGFSAFRAGQEEAIAHLLGGRHVLAVMPTGAGKSLIYQLAALQSPGVTLVISPLIALMNDQVESLKRRGIPATCITSIVSAQEQARRLASVRRGEHRLVYVAPERLRSVPFREALQGIKVSLLAVDEAHCISEWGHDFRPDYLGIGSARKDFGEPVTAALTATATPEVQNDITRLLGIPAARRIITGFNRPNLTFRVSYAADETMKLRALQEQLAGFENGAAIIYVGTRRDAEEVADFAREVAGLDARHYHAGMEAEERTKVENAFLSGKLPVVVATNAFGMGIDRADVRMVIHYSVPGALEAYYQEAGRGGRDGKPAEAVLIYSPEDRALQEWFIENSAPSPDELRAVFGILRSWGRPEGWTALSDLSLVTGLHEVKVRVGLAQLESAGALSHLGDAGLRMLLRIGEWNDQAVGTAMSGMRKHRDHRMRQLNGMVTYAESNACRRRILLEHFGDESAPDAPRCCDNCLSRQERASSPVTRGDVSKLSDSEMAALTILDTIRRIKWEIGRGKLVQLLRGSRAKEILKFGYDKHKHYGKLADYAADEVNDMIAQLISQGYIKVIGGELPVLRLTPKGQDAMDARAAIPLRMPQRVRKEVAVPKKREREVGQTVELTAGMFDQGLSVTEIAGQRGLTVGTIYEHATKLLEQKRIALDRAIPDNIAAQIRSAIERAGPVHSTVPIKELLPEEISYGHIRCVLAADGITLTPDERISHVVSLGNAGDLSGVPELIAALEDDDGNVRRLAASALGKLQAREAAGPLLDLLSREDMPQVRQYAVKALGRIGDEQARTALELISGDPAEKDYTRSAAVAALERLGASPEKSEEPVDVSDDYLPTSQDEVTSFLQKPHPKPLAGPWHSGWALGFHSGFSGADWSRSGVGQLAYQLKYQSDPSVLKPLVEHIAHLCREHRELVDVDAIVPVPPSMARDFDPVPAMADALGAAFGLPVLDAVMRTRKTAPQKEMRTLAQKRANVAGAFSLKSEVRNKRLLVVDDLYDSGATLAEIHRVLSQAGVARICVLTLTRTIHSDA